MKSLIVNADDFGLHTAVNHAIIEGYEKGCLRSTSLMPTGSAVEEAAEMARRQDLATIATFFRRVQWAALGLFVLWVVSLLSPILSPFVFAALLGWLGDPMVDRLQARGMGRNSAVILVFAAMSVVLLVALLPSSRRSGAAIASQRKRSPGRIFSVRSRRGVRSNVPWPCPMAVTITESPSGVS